VLGFSALQLSPDRDPLAPNAEANQGLDLHTLLRDDLVQCSDTFDVSRWRPRIAAATAEERAMRGYLLANCSNCHNPRSPLDDVGLFFDQSTAEDLMNDQILERLSTRNPQKQMPPLGTRLVDSQAIALLEKVRMSNSFAPNHRE
jgi:mono/diheme cytochrome c family protein